MIRKVSWFTEISQGDICCTLYVSCLYFHTSFPVKPVQTVTMIITEYNGDCFSECTFYKLRLKKTYRAFALLPCRMLIPKKNRIAIYEYLFKEGVMVAKKDFNNPKHPDIEGVPNLQVIKAAQVGIKATANIMVFRLQHSKLICTTLLFVRWQT